MTSSGAQGMRLHLSDLDLPKGCKAYWMNDEIVDGPYEHQDNIGNDGDVWTSTIFSDVATFLLTCSPGEDGESLPQQVLKSYP